uniref:GABA(A) receptor-associated protein like 2 n=1 Tax=Cyprinus carpio TaxID=7962 RepID=A0A8C2CIW0_CYPCA
MKWMFKEDHSLEHRCVESAKIRNKYPDRDQVIVEKVSGSQIVDIDKRKYLVPSDITVAQFMWIIRKRIQLPSEKAIFLFVDKTVPQSRYSPALFITKTLLSTVPIKKYLTCPDLTMLISSLCQNT